MSDDTITPPLCPVHHVPAIPISANVFYGKDGSWSGRTVWKCPEYDCDYRVGSHPNGKPLGDMANAELRQLRIKAHNTFDVLWKENKNMSRKAAYRLLATLLGTEVENTHISQMTEDECHRVIEVVTDYKQETGYTETNKDADDLVKEYVEWSWAFHEHKVDYCFHCKRKIETVKQVGRCVYAYPCGDRLYQGKIPESWK